MPVGQFESSGTNVFHDCTGTEEQGLGRFEDKKYSFRPKLGCGWYSGGVGLSTKLR
jgi:hypothetical protein